MASRLHTEGQPDVPVGQSVTASKLTPILRAHPLAERIPLPTEAEYDQVRDDITENGQHLPIVLYEGLILDGRTRYRACREAGIEPLVRHFDPDIEGSPLLFVISMNLSRRSLNEAVKLVVRQEAVADLRAEGMTNEAIARTLGINERTVRRDQQRRRLTRVGKEQRAEDDPNRHGADSESAVHGPAGPRVITTKRGDKRPATYAPRKSSTPQPRRLQRASRPAPDGEAKESVEYEPAATESEEHQPHATRTGRPAVVMNNLVKALKTVLDVEGREVSSLTSTVDMPTKFVDTAFAYYDELGQMLGRMRAVEVAVGIGGPAFGPAAEASRRG